MGVELYFWVAKENITGIPARVIPVIGSHNLIKQLFFLMAIQTTHFFSFVLIDLCSSFLFYIRHFDGLPFILVISIINRELHKMSFDSHFSQH
ncbi:hypothetical protein CHISP_2019 [Chitinispirillum alkaliphilum]|nr:hypothetical protein CHISP_2019 [Chitinispirillum alkaliphilum]